MLAARSLRPARALAVRHNPFARCASSNAPTGDSTTGPAHTPHPGPAIASQTPDAATPAELQQSPNIAAPWSTGQNPKPHAMSGPRFEQTAMQFQPNPLSAMGMVKQDPIRLVTARRATCDGGGGPLGHPKVFINLDKPGPKACGYCGIRFEQAHDAHH